MQIFLTLCSGMSCRDLKSVILVLFKERKMERFPASPAHKSVDHLVAAHTSGPQTAAGAFVVSGSNSNHAIVGIKAFQCLQSYSDGDSSSPQGTKEC